MAGSRQLKRVSWAPDLSIRKVRLFLSEDAPYRSGLDPRHNLQPKGSASFLVHAGVGPTNDEPELPPGFEFLHNNNKQNQNKSDISQIPLIKWKSPPKFVLNPEWCVVSGEESQERNEQNKRNCRVLEEIYPRQFTIPPNPSFSSDAHESQSGHNDNSTPLVPLTAIEEDDSSDPVQPIKSLPPRTQPPPVSVGASSGGPGPQLDVKTAVSATATAPTSNTEQGSAIDHNLLIKILSNPSLVQKLVSQNPNSNKAPLLPQVNVPSSLSTATSSSTPPPPHHTNPFLNPNSNPNPRPPRPQQAPSFPSHMIARPPNGNQGRGRNYYTTLIQQYGGQSVNNNNNGSGGVKNTKRANTVRKACAYFNTAKGCRHGASCMFVHDNSMGVESVGERNKRVKVDNCNYVTLSHTVK